jgi:excisionase family DNA binding protein
MATIAWKYGIQEAGLAEVETKKQPRWGTYEDAEKMCGLSRWTLWRLAKAGHIRAAKVGGATRLDLDSLAAFLEEQADKYPRNRV